MYKQWHISGVANLKVCASATAHTQTVSANPKKKDSFVRVPAENGLQQR